MIVIQKRIIPKSIRFRALLLFAYVCISTNIPIIAETYTAKMGVMSYFTLWDYSFKDYWDRGKISELASSGSGMGWKFETNSNLKSLSEIDYPYSYWQKKVLATAPHSNSLSVTHTFVWGDGTYGHTTTSYFNVEIVAPTLNVEEMSGTMLCVGEERTFTVGAKYPTNDFTNYGAYTSYSVTCSDANVLEIKEEANGKYKIIAKGSGKADISIKGYVKSSSYNGSYLFGQKNYSIEVVEDKKVISFEFEQNLYEVNRQSVFEIKILPTPNYGILKDEDFTTEIIGDNVRFSAIRYNRGLGGFPNILTCISYNSGNCKLRVTLSNGYSRECEINVSCPEFSRGEEFTYSIGPNSNKLMFTVTNSSKKYCRLGNSENKWGIESIYKETGSTIEIPEFAEGYQVVEIGDNAFRLKPSFEELNQYRLFAPWLNLIIPQSVKKIGKNAFADNELTYLSFRDIIYKGDELPEIDNDAFGICTMPYNLYVKPNLLVECDKYPWNKIPSHYDYNNEDEYEKELGVRDGLVGSYVIPGVDYSIEPYFEDGYNAKLLPLPGKENCMHLDKEDTTAKLVCYKEGGNILQITTPSGHEARLMLSTRPLLWDGTYKFTGEVQTYAETTLDWSNEMVFKIEKGDMGYYISEVNGSRQKIDYIHELSEDGKVLYFVWYDKNGLKFNQDSASGTSFWLNGGGIIRFVYDDVDKKVLIEPSIAVRGVEDCADYPDELDSNANSWSEVRYTHISSTDIPANHPFYSKLEVVEELKSETRIFNLHGHEVTTNNQLQLPTGIYIEISPKGVRKLTKH